MKSRPVWTPTTAISAWDFTNYNSGASAVDTPYRIPNTRARFIASDSPLRQGSYRVLAATANNFAREAFTDELAEAAGKDPLEFRLAHLDNDRIKDVLKAAAERFGWLERRKKRRPGTGIGLACGTEKNSVVAACCEVEVDRQDGRAEGDRGGAGVRVRRHPESGQPAVAGGRGHHDGPGPGPARGDSFQGRALDQREIRHVPASRASEDLPKLEVILLDRKDLEPAGAGETPIIAIAPAIANAVFDATGKRVRAMPMAAARG